MGFVKFMVSPAGRLIRAVAGIALIVVGLLVVKGTVGIVLAVVGVVPLAAGIFDLCIFAPPFGMSLSGGKVREGQK